MPAGASLSGGNIVSRPTGPQLEALPIYTDLYCWLTSETLYVDSSENGEKLRPVITLDNIFNIFSML